MGIFQKLHDSLKLCLETISSLMKVVLLSKRTENLKDKRDNPLLVLGNGPSLKAFMQDHSDFMEGKDLMMVNFSACSDEFVRLKPKYYVMIDPGFFENRESLAKAFDAIVKRTEWNLVLFVPMWARSKPIWKEKVIHNSHIRVVYLNLTPVQGYEKFCHVLYDRRLGMPRPRNVLVACLMQGIWMGYREIYLAGADHSWMKDIWVDNDNLVRMDDKHYYDKGDKKSEATKFKMYFWMECFSVVFRSYMYVEEYAKDRGVQILNVTEDSYIDAFQRLDL